MNSILILFIGIGSLMAGAILGYLARQSIAKKKADTLESTLHKKLSEAKERSDKIIERAKRRSRSIVGKAEEEEREIKRELLKMQKFLRRKESNLEEKSSFLTIKEKTLRQKVEKLKQAKEAIGELREQEEKKLEQISGLSAERAKEEMLELVEKEYEVDILERIRKLENSGEEQYRNKAREILASAIQRYAPSQAQEITTSVVHLPNDDLKGRIIGKGGRNIKILEKLTGIEVVVDDTPETVLISGFNPTRRQIAKLALENLVKDGRIQPTRIEDEVEKASEEIKEQIKKAGEQAVFQTGVLGLDPKLVQLLGRLHFRTSYGQNMLLHSIEVCELAGALAAELGSDVDVCKRAGLLHDIGKSVDRQVEGSHVDIGIKILQKFDESQEVIDAMKSHHEDYEPESIEAVLVQVADQISGARPGARKESLEDYLKRLENLESTATAFKGVSEAYAIQAGRELRVFVTPEEVSDLEAHKLAREIAEKIEQELKYPGKIKVTLIREKRVIEYAK